jgi:hypothetical protein
MSQKLRLKYVTDGCLLLINPKGRLRILYTPFRALCIKESSDIPINTWVYVEAVFVHNQYKIGYLINGNIHPYSSFQINISY